MKTLTSKAAKTLVFAIAAVGIPWGLWAYSNLPTDTDNLPIGYVARDAVTNLNLVDAGGTTEDPVTGEMVAAPGLETLYRVEYNRERWSGDLHAHPLDAAAYIYPTTRWSAADRLLAQVANDGWDTGRFIATLNNASTVSGIAFRDDLASAVSVNGENYSASDVVDFVRGDTSNDGANGGQMRIRNGPLGDIVHSTPYYVDDETNPTVFVGANDGMLHAFNADTGAERWAYVPSMLLGKLHKLAYSTSDADQPFKHEYYVDGQIVVSNIKKTDGTTIRALFGGLGGGGKGLYALDISSLSDPTSETEVGSKIMWEIAPNDAGSSSTRKRNGQASVVNSDYSRLGYTYGLPYLVKINTTVGTTPSSVNALIVGNGYDDGAAGVAHLYVINAETGALMKDFAVGPYSSLTGANGIFNPLPVDADEDGNVDTVYGADLNGSLWKFDLRAAWTSASSWTAPSAPLFSNRDGSNNYQPVTSSLGIAKHPRGGYLIAFGTGSTLNGTYGVYANNAWTSNGTGEMDISSPDAHYVYGIWDGSPGTGTITPSNLTLQTLTERMYGANRVRRASANTPQSSDRGWKVALPAGERIVGEGSFIRNGRFYFNSYNPTVTPYPVPGTNTYVYGENWLMELNYLTGGSSAAPFLDLDNNLLLNDNDRIAYTDNDTLPTGKVVGDRIVSPSEDGLPVGKFIATGVQSQPIVVTLATLNTTLLNQNPDVIYPTASTLERGVAGGHFDVDFFIPTADCSNLSGGGSKGKGSVKFDFSKDGVTVSALTIKVGSETVYSKTNINKKYKNSTLDDTLFDKASANYVLKKNSKDSSTIDIFALNSGSAYNGTVTVTLTTVKGNTPGYSVTNVSGGSSASSLVTATSSTKCDYTLHDHEYDDQYDRTGVNFLNASDAGYNLSKAIPSTATEFKVLLMNQYLNPAMQLNIGRTDYNYTSLNGYVNTKNYQTGTALQLSDVPTYTRATIGSLVLNMPVDAFTVKDWWGGTPADPRVGVMSTSPQCVFYGLVSSGNSGASANADLYNPVIPPANGDDGAGTKGTNSGVRHNGATTLQIIRADTPQEALEENLAGRPEYGYRLKSGYFFSYVLAEYSIYWHHPRRVCFGDSTTTWYDGDSGGNGYSTASSDPWNTDTLMAGMGWTKRSPADINTGTESKTPNSGSSDPKIGALGQAGGTVTTSVTTVAGNVTTTTITYVDGSVTIIVTTANSNGTSTIVTTEKNSLGETIGTPTTVTVADASGKVTTGGTEKGSGPMTGRISWRELVRP